MAAGDLFHRASVLFRWYERRHLRTPLAVARRRIATGFGAVALGVAALLFAKIADFARIGFEHIVAAAPLLPLVLTPAVFAGVAYATRRWAPETRGSGIPQVMAAARLPASKAAKLLVSLPAAIFKMLLTVAVLLVGGSVGREGPTVQVSAAMMVLVHRLMRVPITAGVLIAGGAAGVSAAFNTPLAGVAFAIEELAAAYEQRVALLVMGAVMIAGLVVIGIGGDYVYFGVLHETLSIGSTLVIAPTLGVAGGLLGGLFSRMVLGFGRTTSPLVGQAKRRPVLFAAACGLVVALLGITSDGATWGTGYHSSRLLIEGGSITYWFGPAKFLASLATTLSGTPGGIFAPSLAVGAGLGNSLAPLFDAPTSAIVLLGMAAYFVGVVRAPLTAVIILMETTASRSMILPLFATALIADGVSALVCPERLYHGLSKTFGTKPPAAKQSGDDEAGAGKNQDA